MKEIFMALAIVMVFLTCSSNIVEAKAFAHEQLDKVFAYVEQNPAASPANTLTLNVDVDTLQKNFNADIEAILAKAPFESNEEREVMEKLFLIKDYKIFEADAGDFFSNIFGDSVAIFGVISKSDARFKLLSCAYTAPENKNDMTLSSLVLSSFVKVILPNVNPEQFLRELMAEQSGTLTRDGVKFSLGNDNGLILLSAVKEN